MIKKVAFVISLFLIVDRAVYHKLGRQEMHKETYAFSQTKPSPLHEAAAKKRKMRERLAHALAALQGKKDHAMLS